jgi:hypothetical protein
MALRIGHGPGVGGACLRRFTVPSSRSGRSVILDAVMEPFTETDPIRTSGLAGGVWVDAAQGQTTLLNVRLQIRLGS